MHIMSVCVCSICSCFGELSQSIMISESLKNDDLHESYLKKHFPDFLWLMRDCDLELHNDAGEEISATDYIRKKVLVLKSTGKTSLSARDRTVNSILTIFPKIECLQVTNPGSGISKPKKKNTIDRDFFLQIDAAIRHILTNVKAKHVGFNGTTAIDGPMLASLLEHYVDALNGPNTIPNLEVSYWTAVDTTIIDAILKKTDFYGKHMTTLVDSHLPMEEGDLVAVESALESRLEEASQRVLEPVDLPLSVTKTETLFQIHQLVFDHLLSTLSVVIHKLIPNAPTSDERAQSDTQQRKIQFLQQFQRIIVKTDLGMVTGGYIKEFIRVNYNKSESVCKEAFEKVYGLQYETGNLSLQKLRTDYYAQAKGPAKDRVFQCLYSEIPGPPVELSFNYTLDQNQVKIIWKKPEIHPDVASRYEVQWHKKDGNLKGETVFNGCEYKLQSLLYKKKYFVKVRAISKCKNWYGELSEELTFETEPGKPDMPENQMIVITPETAVTARLEVTMLSDSKVNGSPVTHIRVGKQSVINPAWKYEKHPVDPDGGMNQTFTIDTVCQNNEQVLWFQIQFKNEAGLSEPSRSVRLAVQDMIPGEPEDVATVCRAREIEVTWKHPKTNPSAVKCYHIQYWEKRDNQKLVSTTEKKINHLDKRLLIDALVPKTVYSIRLYACNANDKHSSYVSLTAETLLAPPNKPQLHTVKVISATRARLSFLRQPPSEENGSEVSHAIIEQYVSSDWKEIGEYPVQPYSQNSASNVNLEFELCSLTSKSTLRYQIRTKNSKDKSEPSQVVEIFPENIIPGEPDQIKAPDNVVTSNSIKIVWKKPRISPVVVDRYQLQYKTTDESSWTSKKVDFDTLCCTVSELKPNTEYKFMLQAMNGQLASKESKLAVTTKPSVPPKPRPPIAVPKGQMFMLQVYLPAVRESGREVSKLHVHNYNYTEEISPSKTEAVFDIDHNKIKKEGEKRYYEQHIKVNIDEIRWISVSLTNEVGKGEESDLIGLSSGDVTPGMPDDLTCSVEARQAKLSWKVPKINGNAAKYYEVLIKEKEEWKTQDNCTILQKRSEHTLSYSVILRGLTPYTLYDFGVQAVNNTTKKTLISDLATCDNVRTGKSPPEKPSSPIVELINDGSKRQAYVEVRLLSKEDMNGSNDGEAILECDGKVIKQINLPKLSNPNSENPLMIKVPVTIPNHTDSKIVTYWFKVLMRNEVGESESSDPYPLPVAKLQPGPPTKVEITDVSAHSMKVKWEAPDVHPALVRQYHLECYQTERNNKKIRSWNTTEKEYKICDLQSGQEYAIKVTAVAVEARSKPQESVRSTEVIYPGPPSSLYVDKIGRDNVKVRWKKPQTNPKEVLFYFVELKKGDCTKTRNASRVEKTRRTRGDSTVFDNLEPFTTYTVSVSSCNDNKKPGEGSTIQEKFKTKMSKTIKQACQVATAPTIAGPFILKYSQAPDKNMDESDEEFSADSSIYPSAPEELAVTPTSTGSYIIAWNPPKLNSDEVSYYNVEILWENGSECIKCYSPQTSLKFPFDASKEYTIRVTSINYHGDVDPNGATSEYTKLFELFNQATVNEIESV